jgi:DNA-binding PadR family transcriptional regulator
MLAKLPAITHLQFLVLEALSVDEQLGRELRSLLSSVGVRNSGPAFYQMMARLEESGLVEGWYEQKVLAGQTLKERRYRLTRNGLRAVSDTRTFYLGRLSTPKLPRCRGPQA